MLRNRGNGKGFSEQHAVIIDEHRALSVEEQIDDMIEQRKDIRNDKACAHHGANVQKQCGDLGA